MAGNLITDGTGVILEDSSIVAGSGDYDPFLGLTSSNNESVEEGFNTDQANVLNNTDNGGFDFTNSITYGALGILDLNGKKYLEFRLDLNEPGGGSASISLDELKIYISNTSATLADFNNTSDTFSSGFTLVYDLSGAVALADSASGSGHDNYRLLVPVSLFEAKDVTDGMYVTLYSRFSDATGGFEEWRALLKDFTPAPAIDINKITIDGTVSGDGVTVLAGDDVTWKYMVTNTGNVALSNVVVTDDQGVAVTYLSGDDGDNKLGIGETWIFTATGKAIAGNYHNTGTVTATYGATSVNDSDTSSYFGAKTGIAIDKVTVDGATEGDSLTIIAGESIGWKYTVTNTGNVELSNISVTDDKGVTLTFASGDADNDGRLDVTETWIYTGSGTAQAGAYSNTGKATGSFTDSAGHTSDTSASDGSSYFGAAPSIDVEKFVSIDNGVTWLDADTVSGPILTDASGISPKFKFVVTNNGNVALSNVVLHDDTFDLNGAAAGTARTIGTLAANAKDEFIFTAAWTAGQHTNVATAKGAFTDSAGHTVSTSDSDAANYFGFDVGVHGLSQGFWGQHQEAWDGNLTTNRWDSLVGKDLSKKDVLSAPTKDWNGDGSVNSGDIGVLLGDRNANGGGDVGENTLWVSLTAARQIIQSSDSANDTRQILMKQALAAQLNINNGDKAPVDLLGEAVAWLKGQGPYTYWDGSSGKVDTNGDGVLSATEYNTTSKAFTFDANGSLTGTALTSNLQAWKYDVSVYSGLDSIAGTFDGTASGEDLKNALEAYDLDKLMVSADGAMVAWSTDHGVSVTSVHANTNDHFWLTLAQSGLIA